MDKKIEILKKLRDVNYDLRIHCYDPDILDVSVKAIKINEDIIDILRNQILEEKAFPNCSEEEIILLDLELHVGEDFCSDDTAKETKYFLSGKEYTEKEICDLRLVISELLDKRM